jgi:hypothetical protein
MVLFFLVFGYFLGSTENRSRLSVTYRTSDVTNQFIIVNDAKYNVEYLVVTGADGVAITKMEKK